MQADLAVVLQHLNPREAIRIRPDRVVDAREIDVELSPSFFQEMRQQVAELMERQRKLQRKQELVPVFGRRRRIRVLRNELVRDMQVHASDRSDTPRQHDKQIQTAGDLPAPEIARRGRSPTVRRKAIAGSRNRVGSFQDVIRAHAGFGGGEFRCELRVLILQRRNEAFER